MEAYIQSELEASPKLYLLQNRLEPDKDCPPSHKTLHFRSPALFACIGYRMPKMARTLPPMCSATMEIMLSL
ncbi:hypothetical protein L208DRAFT_1393586 [Tricholoma matsutake]|nr:hypothetical protein L208DRAFT_1393586 [Tricholoma matsutake 945]